MKDLELRKRALAAESEVYRETLKLEVRNLNLYARNTKNKFTRPQTLQPWLWLAAPLTSFLIRRRRPKLPRLVSTALLGWQFYNKVAPYCRDMFRFSRFSTERAVVKQKSIPPSPFPPSTSTEV